MVAEGMLNGDCSWAEAVVLATWAAKADGLQKAGLSGRGRLGGGGNCTSSGFCWHENSTARAIG